MKRNRIYHYFGWLALSTLLLTTACAGIADLDVESKNVSGPNTVTLTIQSQAQASGMRDATKHETHNTVISRGDSANVLIFAVYKVEKQDGNDVYTVAEKFGKGDLTKDKKFTNKLSDGQTAIDVEKFPITLQFLIEDDGKYRVAFWAQNGETEAYDTQDLTKVEVKYSKTIDGKQVNFLNNTENRDAFCAFSGEISASTKNMQVTLTRPLAQINVGTAGWDYEGAAVLRPGSVSYNQSTMTLKGVARYYNVLKGETLADDDLDNEKDGAAIANVTFEPYRLPAFINVSKDKWSQPQIHPYYRKTVAGEEGDSIQVEEFLTVDLNKDKIIKPYYGWDLYNTYRKTNPDFLNKGKLPDTEQFKYLSMCYVLVPESSNTTSGTDIEHSEDNGSEKGDDANAIGSTVVDVEFTFKGVERTDDGFGDEVPFQQTYKVNSVPVKKNWRTNLLSKEFFTYSTTFNIDVVPEYCGNYNDDIVLWGDSLSGGSWPDTTIVTHEVSFNTDNSSCNDGSKVPNVSFFQYEGTHSHADKYKGKYGGTPYGYGLKLVDTGGNGEIETVIKFTTQYPSTVIIVQSNKFKDDFIGPETENNVDWITEATIKFDGKQQQRSWAETPSDDKNEGVLVYTLTNVPAGEHRITIGDSPLNYKNRRKQPGILYIKVETQDTKDEDTKFGEDNPQYGDDPYRGENQDSTEE